MLAQLLPRPLPLRRLRAYHFRRMKHSRRGIVIVLLVALVASGALRQISANMRGEHDPQGAGVPLSRMNSYALALLLGGLRGPLVMFLWPSSEGQKSEKNIEDLDTKIEWIRLLQAEFDTVHIFQIWNKAYNISVLMANLPNKYATILDALDYAKSVDAERPGNLTILYEIHRLFFDKLGSSNEKMYYRARVREESQARQPLRSVTLPAERRAEFLDAATSAGAIERRLKFRADPQTNTLTLTLPKPLADQIEPRFSGVGVTWADRPRVKRDRNDPGWRRVELDPMLDGQGNILPELTEPHANASATPGGNDGSELQYLKQFQPYPYGISTLGLGYNYAKRAQMLLRDNNQHHAQLSDLVVDSRAALSLRDWSEEEWGRGRAAELDALSMPVPENFFDPDEKLKMEMPSAKIKLDAKLVNRAALEESIFSYDRAVKLAGASLEEYKRHLAKFPTNFDTYQSHMALLEAESALLSADRDFLKLLAAPADARAALARSAADAYSRAVLLYRVHLLKFYVTPEQVKSMFPKGVDPATIDAYAADHRQEVEQLAETVAADVRRAGQQSPHLDDYNEYMNYIRRAQARGATLAPLVSGTARR
jgi:hypothetical protein